MVGLPFTLRQLEVFERLCASQSFRSASEELGISQAAVSNQIKALETQLGKRLLARNSGRRPQLTSEGAAFLSDLGPFWNAAKKLAAYRRRKPLPVEEEPCTLKVLIGLQLLEDYVRPALSSFLQRYPRIQLDMDPHAAFAGPRKAIASGMFDLALFSESSGNTLGKNYSEVSRIVCGIYGHRRLLEGRTEPFSAEELSQLPFVMPPADSFHDSETLAMFARHNIRPASILGRTPYFDVANAMLETGACVGVALQSLLRPEQRETVVLLHRLEDWRLTLYRNPQAAMRQVDIAAEFLVSSVIGNPAYPAFTQEL